MGNVIETDESDEELMASYQKGQVAAFTKLLARHEKPLWNFVRRFVRDQATAEDLVQETFLRVVRGAAEWTPEARFSTWLYTISRNLCTDHARRMVHRKAASLDGPQGADGDGEGPRKIDRVAGADRGAEVAAWNRERAAAIEAALGELPAEQREVFLMREMMDLPFADIAAIVGTSEPTVKSRMRYALERLREALAGLRDSGTFAAVPGQAGELS